jgi:predicted RND superfamily exporter protein
MKLPALADKLARAQTRHPLRFLAVTGVLTVVAVLVALGLKFDSSYQALLPEDAPRVKNVDAIREATGGTRQLVVAIGGKDPVKRLEFGRALLKRIENRPDIRCIDLEFPSEFFADRSLWLMGVDGLDRLIPALEEAVHVAKVQANPLALHLDEEAEKEELEAAWKKVDDVVEAEKTRVAVGETMVSDDGKYTFMLVVPSIKFADVEAGGTLLRAIQREVDALAPKAAGLEVRFAGNLHVVQEQHKTMRRDLQRASILALILGALLVAGFTRRPLAPLIVGLALVSGVTWTFAMTRIVVGQVNIITGFLAAVLIGLGIDFGIHLYVRYRQERTAAGASASEAVIAAVRGTLPPALTSALTTAGVFLSFTIADFRGFSEFGLIAGIGVLLTLASSFLIVPPILVVLDRLFAGKLKQPPPRQPDRSRFRLRLPVAVIFAAGFVAFAAFGAANITQVPFRNNFKLLRGYSAATEFSEYVDENMGAGFNPAVILTRSPAAAQRVGSIIDETRDRPANGKRSRIGKSVSVSDFLPRGVAQHRPRIEKLRQILLDPKLDDAAAKEGDRADQLRDARRMVQTEPWGVEELPDPIKRRFISIAGDEYLVYLWSRERNNADYQAAAWDDELTALSARFDDQQISHRMADETLMMAWIYRMILADGVPLLTIAALVVIGFLMIDFRNPLRTALVFLPLGVGMLVFVAAIRALGMQLNMFNMVVLPSVIGIGIDNAVHIYHRYRTEGPGSVPLVIRTTGAAALLASMTTGVGFGSALISHHVGLTTLGLLAVVGIGATFLADVLFFPCVLMLIERFRGRG